jgi:glycosyltransferase involved in cell wall biosynthesis
MTRVTYLITTPKNVDPQREAIAQDIAALSAHVQARVVRISLPERLRPIYPERLFGLWLLPRLRALESQTDLFHVFHAHPRFFTLFNVLRKPVVYSVVSGLRANVPPNKATLFNRLAQVVVSNTRDQQLLAGWGVRHAMVIRPSIALEKFLPTPAPPVLAYAPFHLFMGSAPWTLPSFQHKGIDSLLAAMRELPNLHITFLWRDFLYSEMMQRVRALSLEARAVVLNKRVDVAAQLALAHAAVLVADDASIIKAYPNSLMEAIACARPVLISQHIPMSDDVAAHGCGVVVPDVAAATLTSAIRELMNGYPRYQQAVAAYPVQQFSRQRWLQDYLGLYRQLLPAQREMNGK